MTMAAQAASHRPMSFRAKRGICTCLGKCSTRSRGYPLVAWLLGMTAGANFPRATLLGWFGAALRISATKVECRIDEGDVGEGLGEVPDLTVHPRVIFFSEKSDVV